jgi:hemolysin D
MGLRWQAIKDLFARYSAYFKQAWEQREALEPPERLPHEHEFLPAALSLQETPVHPAPRIAMRVIIAFAVIAVLWAVFGKVDIVATARGKIIPSERSKVIQPLDTAIVKAIHVQDGQRVNAGDLLVELDATTAQADTDRSRADWQQEELDVARAHAMLNLLNSNNKHNDNQAQAGLVTFDDPLQGANPALFVAALHQLQGQYSEYQSKWQQLDGELAQHRAERESTLQNLIKLQETLPIARETASDLKELSEKDFVPRHDYLQKEQARIENESDLAATQAKIKQLDATILTTERQETALTAETRRAVLDQLHEAEQKMNEYEQDFIKANGHRTSMTLAAPVEGTVQQLAVHTVGGVVTPAQQLMVIVPTENVLEVEAFVQNADIGFVNAGQEAQIKVDTFPFTRYGTIHGQVLQVSDDAIQEDARQATSPKESQTNDKTNPHDKPSSLVYAARVRLGKSSLEVDGKNVHLGPGMEVTVEIKTGKRRLVEYFLSPLLQYKDESLRER